MSVSGANHGNRTVHRGWFIVAVIFLASALNVGPIYAFGLFIDPLENEFGWGRTTIAASLSFAAIGSVASPLIGRLMDRYGARPLMFISLLIMGTSFALRPFMVHMWHWYLLSLMQYVAGPGAHVLPVGRLVNIWFNRTRGRVIGFATMGTNFGGLTIPLITGFLLASGNWKIAYLILGVLAYSIAFLAIVIVRDFPDCEADSNSRGQIFQGNKLSGMMLSDALKTTSFYLLAIATLTGSFTYSGVLPQIADHLISSGMRNTIVPFAISLLAIFGMGGKVGFGYLSEMITARKAMMLSVAGQSVFVTLLVIVPLGPLTWIVIALYGLFMGGYGALISIIVQETFGIRYFGSISGLIMIASVISFSAGPLLAGLSYDISDSYGPGFVVVAIMLLTSMIALIGVRRHDQV